MGQQTSLAEQRLRLSVLLVMATITIALFALGQNAAAVVSVLTNLGLVINSLGNATHKHPHQGPEEGTGSQE